MSQKNSSPVKKKKKKEATFLPPKKQKINVTAQEKKATRRSLCAHAHGHFCQSRKKCISTQFSFHFGGAQNILVGLGRKHLGPTIYFSSSPPNQTYSKKNFIPIFSPKFSIHHVSLPNKHTLKLQPYSLQEKRPLQQVILQ